MNNRWLIPLSGKKFKMTALPIFVEMNKAKEMLYIISDRDTSQYSKAVTPILDNKYLKKYTGKFFSTETNSTNTVYLKDGKLLMNVKPNLDIELSPTYNDAFNIPGYGGNAYFLHNRKNEIVALKVSIARARNVEFEKLK
jgi:hypothetical protein